MSDSFVTWWTAAHQAPLSMGFLRQQNWIGLPFPSPRDFPKWGIKPASPALAGGLLSTAPPAKSIEYAGFGTTRPPLETLDHIPLRKMGTTVWPNSSPKWFSQPYYCELRTEFTSLSYCNCQRFRFFPVWWVQQSLWFDYLAHCSKTQILIDALWYFILRRDHNLLSFPFLLGTQCVPNFLLCEQRFIEHPCT